MKKILLCAAFVCFLIFLALILSGSFYPKTLTFIEPVLCPTGTRLDDEIVERNLSRRNSQTTCRADNGEIVYVTGRLLIIGLIPLLSSFLLLAAQSRIKS